jgi:hypothetical protein
MVRAYVLVETTPDKVEAIRDSIGHGLTNCLAIGHTLVPGEPEVMVVVQCDQLKYLNQAINDDWVKLDGVRRITTCLVVKGN